MVVQPFQPTTLPKDLCVHQLIERQAEKKPAATAVVSGDDRLTYGELNGRANQIARWLQVQGAGPDVLVGLLMERSLDMVVAILAILKAGSGYVPLEPLYPPERLAYLLDDTRTPILLTQYDKKEALPNHSAHLLCIDQGLLPIDQYGTSNLEHTACGRNLAYVIYTSGSTGRPKGVLTEHRSLTNYILEAIDKFKITSTDRVLQFASLSFDTAAEEIYPILIQGGTLVLRTNEMLASVPTFLRTCAAWGITVLDLPTSYWQQLVLAMIEHNLDLATVRLVIIGGERALPERVFAWNSYLRNRHKEVRLWNTYGPTETTIVATMKEVSGLVESFQREIPIGKSVRNSYLRILDDSLQQVPHGEEGELFIGGIGVARGYLNQPDLTSQAFIRDPFCVASNTRLYKTGDIVRQCSNGDLEHIRRTDDQVKLNGFRVELGEVESALNSHNAVTQAIACVGKNQAGRKGLVAYVITKLPPAQANTALRNDLKTRLPHYMIPERVIKLETLPLTIRGKVDRMALSALVFGIENEENSADRSHTETQQRLLTIWRKVLRIKLDIGINDDFFTLGGDSLLAIRALSELNQMFGVELSLRYFFTHPTITQMATAIDATAHQGCLVANQYIHAQHKQDQAPLSYQQEGLWIFERLVPGTTVHTVSQGFRLKGQLDVEVLHKSFTELIQRHQVLRTSYVLQGDSPVQNIFNALTLDLTPLDLRNYPRPEGMQIAQKTLQDEVNRPFDFPAGPLLRVRLLRIADDEYWLFLLVHHSVFDGWSLGILLNELEMLYATVSQSKPSPLPILPIQYADYAVWQRAQNWDKQLAYWRKQLSGERSAVLLPADYPRTENQGTQGAVELLRLPNPLVTALRVVSKRHDITPFIVFLSAFKVLLYRYTNETDLTIGSLAAGRSRPELDRMIGYVANVIALRTHINPNHRFPKYLEAVKNMCLDAYANQDIPFELIAQKLRSTLVNKMDIIEILFIHYHVRDRQINLPGISAERFDIYAHSSHGELTVWIDEDDEKALVIAEYDSKVFKAETIQRFLCHYRTLLESIAENEDVVIAKLEIFTTNEQRQRSRWNSTQADYPQAKCIHQLISIQAHATPEATAIVYENEEITYRALDQQSNQLARFLRDKGVGRGFIVAVCIDRSPGMVLGILAILKVGAAYLPLNFDDPPERQAFMLDDAGVSTILTEHKLSTRLPIRESQYLFIDSDEGEFERFSTTGMDGTTHPDDLAYILYTSGSTGKPKGVMIPHRAVVNLLTSMAQTPGLTKQDTVLAIALLTFDISALELFLPLIVGARTIIVSRASAANPQQLMATCKNKAVTLLQATPVTWRLLLEAGWHGPTITALCGGEVMSRDIAGKLVQQAGKVWNMYGPTETTIWSSCYEIKEPKEPILIGWPIANTRFYVFNKCRQPAPIGVPGEIYIGGPGVAQGYLNQPELTAERFINAPFEEDFPTRLFKTGDLGRYHTHGGIEYLGRTDSQIKLRGFRIELGEIETALNALPTIKQAAVQVREDRPGDQRLIAYAVATGKEITPAQWMKQLKNKLPDYMMPQHIVLLERLPLTSSGKLNRKALPAPAVSNKDQYVAPHTPTEKYLAMVWEEALGLEPGKVGLDDNFFDLGGYSMLAIQVVSRLIRELHMELSLQLVYGSDDLQEVAKRVDESRQQQNKTESAKTLVVSLRSSSTGVPLFCICGIDLYKHVAHSIRSTRPVYAIFISGEGDAFLKNKKSAAKNFPSVKELASRYVQTIIEFLPEGLIHIAGVSFGGILAFEIAQQLRKGGRQVGVLFLLDVVHPHNGFKSRPINLVLTGCYRTVKKLTQGLRARLKFLPFLPHPEPRLIAKADTPESRGVEEIRTLRSLAYSRATDEYEFDSYPGKIVVFQASETKGGINHSIKSDYGWSTVADGELVIHLIPGDHLGIIQRPAVGLLAERLDSHMLMAEKSIVQPRT